MTDRVTATPPCVARPFPLLSAISPVGLPHHWPLRSAAVASFVPSQLSSFHFHPHTMLACVAPHVAEFHSLRFLYPLGNTLPRLLTRSQTAVSALSEEKNAATPPFACLLLGCGDLRHVLFTSYCTLQQSLAKQGADAFAAALQTKGKSATAAIEPTLPQQPSDPSARWMSRCAISSLPSMHATFCSFGARGDC